MSGPTHARPSDRIETSTRKEPFRARAFEQVSTHSVRISGYKDVTALIIS